MRVFKTHPILGLVNSYIIDNPEPANISYMWNFGSLLGTCLIIQIITGIFLAMHYQPNIDLAFVSVEHIIRDVNYGWFIRYCHANVASFFFIFVYLHIGRGLYYGSYKHPRTLPWSIGVIILVLIMATAFMGYVLPIGQISLWGILLCLTCSNNINNLFRSKDYIKIYKATEETTKKIHASLRVGPHNKDILSIFYGLLLSDGHAERRSTGQGTRLSIVQESYNSEYLLWLYNKISYLGYCSERTPKIQTRLGLGGKLRQVIRFHTYTYTSLNVLHSAWYVDGVKRIPSDILEYLTPICLAIWIIGDGARVGKGIKLCTNSFTYEECVLLAETLYVLYGLKCSVQSAGALRQYHVYVFAESIPSLKNLVKPFIVPSMLYKLGEMHSK